MLALREGLEGSGKSLRQVALHAHVSPAAVCHTLNGARFPTPGVFSNLVRGIGGNAQEDPWAALYAAASRSVASAKAAATRARARRIAIALTIVIGLFGLSTPALLDYAQQQQEEFEERRREREAWCSVAPCGEGSPQKAPPRRATVGAGLIGARLYPGPDSLTYEVLDPRESVKVFCWAPGPELMHRYFVLSDDGEFGWVSAQDVRFKEPHVVSLCPAWT
ncbi:hypothetical protein [Streptomyces sp. NPDC055794]